MVFLFVPLELGLVDGIIKHPIRVGSFGLILSFTPVEKFSISLRQAELTAWGDISVGENTLSS